MEEKYIILFIYSGNVAIIGEKTNLKDLQDLYTMLVNGIDPEHKKVHSYYLCKVLAATNK